MEGSRPSVLPALLVFSYSFGSFFSGFRRFISVGPRHVTRALPATHQRLAIWVHSSYHAMPSQMHFSPSFQFWIEVPLPSTLVPHFPRHFHRHTTPSASRATTFVCCRKSTCLLVSVWALHIRAIPPPNNESWLRTAFCWTVLALCWVISPPSNMAPHVASSSCFSFLVRCVLKCSISSGIPSQVGVLRFSGQHTSHLFSNDHQ